MTRFLSMCFSFSSLYLVVWRDDKVSEYVFKFFLPRYVVVWRDDMDSEYVF